jgi:hypothetical protein
MNHMRNPLMLALLAAGLAPQAQAQANDWLSCTTITAVPERLACFDQKASQFANPVALQSPPPVPYGPDVAAVAPAPVPSAA